MPHTRTRARAHTRATHRFREWVAQCITNYVGCLCRRRKRKAHVIVFLLHHPRLAHAEQLTQFKKDRKHHKLQHRSDKAKKPGAKVKGAGAVP